MNAMGARVWQVVRLPLIVFLTGIAVVLLLKLALWTHVLPPAVGDDSQVLLVALLVFLVGLAVGGFLWWLTHESFVLLTNTTLSDSRLEMLKDLPLGLPDGTIRAVLALIVALIGLPLLLFSSTLKLGSDTVPLVANIITATFAFYFGQRSGSGDVQANKTLTRTVDQLQNQNGQLTGDNATLQGQNDDLSASNTAMKGTVNSALGSKLGGAIGDLGDVVSTAQTLLQIATPVLPAGTLPASLPSLLQTASNIAAGAQSLVGAGAVGSPDEKTVQTVADMAGHVLGQSGLGSLLKTAAGALLPIVGIGAGPAGLAALVISVGWELGSSEYRRWRARILDAPYETGLISPGLVTEATVRARLPDCPIFAGAFASDLATPGFANKLVDGVLADDAEERLWSAYGGSERFTSRDELQQGLVQFRLALLADQSAADIDDTLVTNVTQKLHGSTAEFVPGTLHAADINKVLDARTSQAAGSDVPRDAVAALQALVLLVGKMRDSKTDIAPLIARLA